MTAETCSNFSEERTKNQTYTINPVQETANFTIPYAFTEVGEQSVGKNVIVYWKEKQKRKKCRNKK